MNKDFVDQLNFEQFYKESKGVTDIKEAKPFNRMIAHSKNFFLISGYGAFTPGYIILITKEFVPSYALVHDEDLEELNFIIKLSKENINESYDRKSIIFEHGMCSCIGGLDRAHLHIMSIHKSSSEKSLKDAINKTLFDRKAGVKHIEFNGYKLENIHDITHFMEVSRNKKNTDFKVIGNILKFDDIKNLEEQKWPKNTLPHVNKGGHYVFFRSDYLNSSFLTTNNFQTQFGRQVVFENECKLDKTFEQMVDNRKKNNEFLELWKWQNQKFEKNIIETINSSKKSLKKFKTKYAKEFEKFKFEIL
tara:strand:- start:33109 stop:34023 length:915 start_codon:yes stop_codon:yes gene_type:complete